MDGLYRRLLDFTRDGVYRYSFEDGRILFANQGFLDILGLRCAPEEVVGKRMGELMIYTEKAGRVRERLEKAGEIHGFEYHFQTIQGEDRWVIHDSFIFDDAATGGRVIEAIVKDVTERKRAETELERHRHHLEELVIERTKALYFVSHDLRNSLTCLENAVSSLHDDLVADHEKRKSILRIALRAIRRLVRTTTDLLDLAKMKADKFSFWQETFSLNALVEEIGQFLLPEIAKKGLDFKAVAPDHDVAIVADRDQIARVLTNLIDNGLKFTREGHIEVRVEEDEACVRCIVADTGRGVEPEDMPKLFQRFSQVGDPHIAHGSGLGLCICREILEAHRGRIWAESAPGKGARFTFTIPKAAAPKGSPASEQTSR